MSTNKERVRVFKKRIEKTKNDLYKNADKKNLIEIIYDKTLKNIKLNKDVNNKKYTKSKYKKGKLLNQSGRLIKSISKAKDGLAIKGNKLDIDKANTHNFGNTIRRKKSPYLFFKHRNGFRKIKKVKIPQREFFPNGNDKISQKSVREFKNKLIKGWK